MADVVASSIPRGAGVFSRAQSKEWLAQWDFVILNGVRNDAEEKARFLVSRNVPFWLYSGPFQWLPEGVRSTIGGARSWKQELPRIAQQARDTGARGFVADPENGWPDLSPRERDVQADELRRSLLDNATGLSVGLTSYPLFPARRTIAQAAGDRIFGMPQLYAKGRPPEAIRQWHREWSQLFRDVVPAVSAWVSDDSISDLEGYRAYLSSIPASPGLAGWTTGEGPAWMMSAFKEFESGQMLFPQPDDRRNTSALLMVMVAGALGFALWRLLS